MSGKSLDEMTPSEHSAYEKGVADTHARYEAMQAQASSWLTACIELVARYEAGCAGIGMTRLQRTAVAGRLREALSLDASVTIAHEHDESCAR